MDKRDVIIIGGGLTGLATAFWLSESGVDFGVLEKKEHLGGVINTHHEGGFTYESGPNTGVLTNIETVELFDRLNNYCKIEIANSGAKRRLIWKGDKWNPLPSGMVEAITTPLFTTADKLRILVEPFKKRGKNPFETLEELVKRRMGQSFLDYAIDPFISGIYAGSPSYLVPKFALPKLYALEQNYGSFILGAATKMLGKKSPEDLRVTKEVFSVEGGFTNLINAITLSVGKEFLTTGVDNINIEPHENFFIIKGIKEGKEIEIKSKFVVTTPGSYELKQMLPFIDDNRIQKLDNLIYPGVVQVVMGFENWNGMELNAFGGLVPSKENKNILGVLFPSSFLKSRAPESGAMLSVFLGGFRNQNIIKLTDEEIKSKALEDAGQMLGFRGSNPDLIRVFRHNKAIPQYGASSLERIEAIAQIQMQFQRLILAGNIHEGIGMADRIKQGKKLAMHIIKAL